MRLFTCRLHRGSLRKTARIDPPKPLFQAAAMKGYPLSGKEEMPASTVHTIFGGEMAITGVMAEESKKVPEKKSRHLALPLLVLVAILGAALGTGLWIRSRHRSVGEPHPQTAAQEVQAVMHLESFTVNLTDKDSSGFLRIGIDLGLAHEISGGKEGEQAARFTPLLRDTLLTELSAWIHRISGQMTERQSSKRNC